MITKVKVFTIGTPYYTLLANSVDGGVCGLAFPELTVAFGVNLPLDYPGEIKYTPYTLRIPRGLTDTLAKYFETNPADSYCEWVNEFIPELRDTPCSNGKTLCFGLTRLGLLSQLAEPELEDCFYPSLKNPEIRSETSFNEAWVEKLTILGSKYGIELSTDYEVIWVVGNSKGLSITGNFVDVPTEPEEPWDVDLG